MSAQFFWTILLVVVLLLGPFAALRVVSHVRIRLTAAQKRRQELLEQQEKEEEARGDRPGGFW